MFDNKIAVYENIKNIESEESIFGNSSTSTIILKDSNDNIVSKFISEDCFIYQKYNYCKNKNEFILIDNDDLICFATSEFKRLFDTNDIQVFENTVLPICEYLNSLDRETSNKTLYPYIFNGYDWVKQAYLYLHYYDKAWDLRYGKIKHVSNLKNKKYITLEDILNIKLKCNDSKLDSKIIINIKGVSKIRLSKFGDDNFNKILIRH